MSDQSENIRIAMMLLEMGCDGHNPQYGSIYQYAWAAHSFLQASQGMPHSMDNAEAMVAKILADSAIEGAAWAAKNV